MAAYADRHLSFLPIKYQEMISEYANRLRDPHLYVDESNVGHISISFIWNILVYIILGYFMIKFIESMAQIEYDLEIEDKKETNKGK